MLTYPWKCTVLHCNHLGNTWKPLVLMTWHFDYCPSASEGDNQSVRSSAPVVSRCFPGGYNVKLYISRGRLARWLLAFLHTVNHRNWKCYAWQLNWCNCRSIIWRRHFTENLMQSALSSLRTVVCNMKGAVHAVLCNHQLPSNLIYTPGPIKQKIHKDVWFGVICSCPVRTNKVLCKQH